MKKYKSAMAWYDGVELHVVTKKRGQFAVPKKLYDILRDVRPRVVLVANNAGTLIAALNAEWFEVAYPKAEEKKNHGMASSVPPYYVFRF